MEKYGFVYIWYDRKRRMFYIGSHWGQENDRYVCSSTWMRNAYRKRPQDFKRRTIARCATCKETLIEEERWLQMIKPDEVKVRYYNIMRQTTKNPWYASDSLEKQKTTRERMSASRKRLMADPVQREKIAATLRGRKLSDEHRAKIAAGVVGKRDYDDPDFRNKMSNAAKNRSDETRKKISDNNKRLQSEGKIGMRGKKHSEETRRKMSESQKRRFSTQQTSGA